MWLDLRVIKPSAEFVVMSEQQYVAVLIWNKGSFPFSQRGVLCCCPSSWRTLNRWGDGGSYQKGKIHHRWKSGERWFTSEHWVEGYPERFCLPSSLVWQQMVVVPCYPTFLVLAQPVPLEHLAWPVHSAQALALDDMSFSVGSKEGCVL